MLTASSTRAHATVMGRGLVRLKKPNTFAKTTAKTTVRIVSSTVICIEEDQMSTLRKDANSISVSAAVRVHGRVGQSATRADTIYSSASVAQDASSTRNFTTPTRGLPPWKAAQSTDADAIATVRRRATSVLSGTYATTALPHKRHAQQM